MPAVARLALAPVKGLGLLHPDALELRADGIPGDHLFHLVTADDGRMVNGKLAGPLVRVTARVDAALDTLTLDFPGGASVAGDARALGEAVETSFYGRPVPGRLVEGPFAEALSAAAGFAVRLVRVDATSAACDVLHPVSVLSRASIDDLARHAGSPALADDRRFRMHVLLDGCTPLEEDGWAGRLVQLGSDAVVRLAGPIPRCTITGQDPATGTGDQGTLKAITAWRGLSPTGKIDLGMYADIVEPGVVRVGDPVTPL